jgi:hypothetical protein
MDFLENYVRQYRQSVKQKSDNIIGWNKAVRSLIQIKI